MPTIHASQLKCSSCSSAADLCLRGRGGGDANLYHHGLGGGSTDLYFHCLGDAGTDLYLIGLGVTGTDLHLHGLVSTHLLTSTDRPSVCSAAIACKALTHLHGLTRASNVLGAFKGHGFASLGFDGFEGPISL